MKTLSRHIAWVGVVLLLMVRSASAVPSLGVATNGPYIGPGPLEAYQAYFASGLQSGADEGFQIGASGSNLLVFTNITGVDIYLLTESSVFANNAPSFTGYGPLVQFPGTGQFDGYTDQPYYGINLGHAEDWNTPTITLPAPPFEPPTFHLLSVPLVYSGALPTDRYFFAIADDNGTAGLQGGGGGDSFSPKTTSAVGDGTDGGNTNPHQVPGVGGVPEPVTAGMVMVGLSVLGLAAVRRRHT